MTKKENKVGFKIVVPIMVLSLFFISIVMIRSAMPLYSNQIYMLIQTVFLVSIVYYIQLLIHEIGHLIFGKLTNYELILFRIGSIVLVKKDEKLKLKRYSPQGSAGQCLMSPPDKLKGEFPFILYNLGGVILNLLVAILFLNIYLLIENRSLFKAFSIGVFLFGIYLATINGLPMELGSGSNDGFNILLILRDRVLKDAYYNQLKINKYLISGSRFKDMDESLFETDLEDKNHLTLSIYLLNIKRLIDMEDYDDARTRIINLLDHENELTNSQVMILDGELLYMDLLGSRDLEEVEKEYDEKIQVFKELALNNISMNRIIYGYELIVKESVASSKKYRDRLDMIFKTYPFKGEIIMEKELLYRLDKKHLNRFIER